MARRTRKYDPKSDSVAKYEKKPVASKPKKYLKKSIEAVQRIERSKHDKIFLLEAKRYELQWIFYVMGTKLTHYHVKVSTVTSCTCMDFRLKKKPCKHIYFIVTQVAQNLYILDFFNSTTKISQAAYKILDDQLTNRLKSRMYGSKKKYDIDLKDDKDCVICFSEMDKETEDLDDCGTCKKYFHLQCINAWKNHNPTCPLCRGALKDIKSDPLGMVKEIKI